MNDQNLRPDSPEDMPDPRAGFSPEELQHPLAKLSEHTTDSIGQLIALLKSFQDCDGQIYEARTFTTESIWGLFDIHRMDLIVGRYDAHREQISGGCMTSKGRALARQLIQIYEILVDRKGLSVFDQEDK